MYFAFVRAALLSPSLSAKCVVFGLSRGDYVLEHKVLRLCRCRAYLVSHEVYMNIWIGTPDVANILNVIST